MDHFREAGMLPICFNVLLLFRYLISFSRKCLLFCELFAYPEIFVQLFLVWTARYFVMTPFWFDPVSTSEEKIFSLWCEYICYTRAFKFTYNKIPLDVTSVTTLTKTQHYTTNNHPITQHDGVVGMAHSRTPPTPRPKEILIL